jgi:hypothetical protein
MVDVPPCKNPICPPCHHRATNQLSGNDLEHRQKVTQKEENTQAQTAQKCQKQRDSKKRGKPKNEFCIPKFTM